MPNTVTLTVLDVLLKLQQIDLLILRGCVLGIGIADHNTLEDFHLIADHRVLDSDNREMEREASSFHGVFCLAEFIKAQHLSDAIVLIDVFLDRGIDRGSIVEALLAIGVVILLDIGANGCEKLALLCYIFFSCHDNTLLIESYLSLSLTSAMLCGALVNGKLIGAEALHFDCGTYHARLPLQYSLSNVSFLILTR